MAVVANNIVSPIMAQSPRDNKAVDPKNQIGELTDRSLHLSSIGDITGAVQAATEAYKLDSQDPRVKKAQEAFSREEIGKKIVSIVERFVESGDENDGHNAMQAISRAQIDDDAASKLVDALLKEHPDRALQDQLLPELLKHPTAQRKLADEFVSRPTPTYRAMWRNGERSIDCLEALMLMTKAWPSEEAREKASSDLFMLLLSRIMEPNTSEMQSARAMRIIARLLDTDFKRLDPLIDTFVFDEICNCLKISRPVELRSQATLVVAEILQSDHKKGEKLLTDYIVEHTSKKTANEFVLAFSAAAAIFPVVPHLAAQQFLRPGFVDDLARMCESGQSKTLRQAALELLSAACIDTNCRESVAKHCTRQLGGLLMSRADDEAAIAGLVLAKTTTKAEASSSGIDDDELVALFKGISLQEDVDQNSQQNAIEGLAYRSINPAVKEALASDSSFLTHLINLLKLELPSNSSASPNTTKSTAHAASRPLLFGGLTILSNLTSYPRRLTQEEKKMAHLRAYANRSQPATEPGPLDSEDRVSARCKAVIDAGAVPLLVSVVSPKSTVSLSPFILGLFASIALALVKHPSHRGKLAQDGILDTLLTLSTLSSHPSDPERPGGPNTNTPTSSFQTRFGDLTTTRRSAALALAQLLISINPALFFTTSAASSKSPRSIPAVTRALSQLFHPADDSSTPPMFSINTAPQQDPATEKPIDAAALNPRETFAASEAIKALTNLATLPQSTALITAASWPFLESTLLTPSVPAQLRCTAVQLIANLASAPPDSKTGSNAAVAKILLEGKPSYVRVRVLVALMSGWTEIDDVRTATDTSLAAGAAVVGISGYSQGVEKILAIERGIEGVIDAAKEVLDATDSDVSVEFKRGMVHRLGVVMVNLSDGGLSEGVRGDVLKKFRECGAKDAWSRLLREMWLGDEVGLVVNEVVARLQ